MDRKEIKELAKKKVNGNLWKLLWPLLIIGAISSVSSRFLNIQATNITTVSYTPTQALLSLIFTLLTALVSAGYIKYLIDFVRKGKFDSNTIINTIKEKWLNIIICNILVGILVCIGCIFLVIPGIILALAYSFAQYLVVDSDISGADSLTKSREMMKGYKLDYLVFILSFLGWFILGVFTFFIAYVWIIPYFYVANTIYFEKLKEKTK